MLLLVPPSESKAPPPADGPAVDLDRLSFPELTGLRRRIVEALAETSRLPDAFARLYAPRSKVAEVVRNTHLTDVPVAPTLEVYTGPLHEGLDAAGLTAAARERADRTVVIVSPVFGAVRPTDQIPPYRCHVCARLVGLDRLEPTWRQLLPATLARAAGSAGLVVDLRSTLVQALGMPAGIDDRLVVLRVDHGPRGDRIGDVVAKRVRGEAAHLLLESGAEPADPGELADVLTARWPVRLGPPARAGRPWELTLSATG